MADHRGFPQPQDVAYKEALQREPKKKVKQEK
jgi:hypothetical protein